jgi:hypothetical protein
LKTNKALPKVPLESEKIIQFRNFQNSTRASIIIYSDFESIIKKIAEITRTAKHEICAYGIKIISFNNFLAEHNIGDFKIFIGSKPNEAISDFVN